MKAIFTILTSLSFVVVLTDRAHSLDCSETSGFFHYHQHGFVKDETGELVLFSGSSYDQNGVETQVHDQPITQTYSVHLEVTCENDPILTITDGYFGKTYADFTIDNLEVGVDFSGTAANGEPVLGVVQESTVDGVSYLTVVLESETLGKFSFDGNRFSVVSNPSCVTSHGDGGFEDSFIIVPEESGVTDDLQNLAEERGWQFIYEDSTLSDRMPTKGHCTFAICGVPILVGFGNEFRAVSEISMETGLCAQRVSAPAGAPPLQVAGIPFSVFQDKSGEDLTSAVQSRVVNVAFENKPTLKLSPVSRVGVGRSFQVRILGYGTDLEITFGEGFWYQGVFQVDIGTNVHGGSVSDTIQLTILDLIEIAAPKEIQSIPEELIRDGRRLDYYDPVSGAQTEDTEKFEVLAYNVISRIAEETGGIVVEPWY